MSRVIYVTDENFEDFIAKSIKPVVVDFWAPWCAPCKMIAPVLDQLSDENEEIIIAKVDVDACPKTAAALRIRSIPTLAIFKDGKLVATKAGAANKTQISAFIDNNT